MTRLDPEVIQTKRLVLVPLDDEIAEHILRGDVSCLDHTGGWPHADTVDGVRCRARGAAVWLVGLGGVVIGDCGTVGTIENGTVEIGFGLAEEMRGQGYGSELVAALADWLDGRDEIDRIIATTRAENVGSRRVLERAGFLAEGESDGVVRYVR